MYTLNLRDWVWIGLIVVGIIAGGAVSLNQINDNAETLKEIDIKIESLDEKLDHLRWEIYQQNMGRMSIVAPEKDDN